MSRHAAGTPAIRPASPDDIPVIRAILALHDNDGPVAHGGADVVGPYVAHLVRHHRVLLTVDEGRAVAFGAVVDTGRVVQLADLFVVPDRLGQGLGRTLLAALFGEAPRRTTFASDDPRALPLYVRAGLMPLWPNLYLAGDAGLLRDAPATPAVRDGSAQEASALELSWTGVARAVDHAFWATEAASADPFTIEDASGPVAFGYGRARQVSDARALGRMLVRPGADAVAPVLAALRRIARRGPLALCLLGPNPALPVLLGLGFRIVDRDQFMASEPGLIDPERLFPNPGML